MVALKFPIHEVVRMVPGALEFPTQCNDPVRSTNRWHDAKKVTAPASDVTWLIDRPQVMCRVSADGFSLSAHKACVSGGLCELGVAGKVLIRVRSMTVLEAYIYQSARLTMVASEMKHQHVLPCSLQTYKRKEHPQ